jgi:hypothetical protein
MFEYRLFTLLFLDGAITHFFNYLKINKKKERIQRSDSQFHEILEEEKGEIK